MDDRILPPPPPPSSRGPRSVSGEADFWAGLFIDLDVRIQWLAQAIDAVPRHAASAESVVRLRSYARAIEDLHVALADVHAHRSDPLLKPLFSLDGPLAGFLSRLYGWCEEIGADFERMAVALRRREPTSIVFSHKKVNQSYGDFQRLAGAMREADARVRKASGAGSEEAWRSFDEKLEELIWAAEWVHMTLARPPGG